MDDVERRGPGGGGDDPDGLHQDSPSVRHDIALITGRDSIIIKFRKVPINFILLGLFTIFEGVSLGMVSLLAELGLPLQ